MKNLLVTLADSGHVEQTKQLFSSAYFNGGWKGRLMLLAYNIPNDNLRWFKTKGILIREFGGNAPAFQGFDSPKTAKFYLFTDEFKEWAQIIYLDADIIVRASLDGLTRRSGFCAASVDAINDRLIDQFVSPSKADRALYTELRKKYPLMSPAFNSGVMVFTTDVIKRQTFTQLQYLYNRYMPLIKPPIVDQPILNLYFCPEWKRLPTAYNILYETYRCTDLVKGGGPIIHFNGAHKPWHGTSPFLDEWKNNFTRADAIDTRRDSDAAKRINASKIRLFSCYLHLRHLLNFRHLLLRLYRLFGLICYFLYVCLPHLYFALVKVKDE